MNDVKLAKKYLAELPEAKQAYGNKLRLEQTN